MSQYPFTTIGPPSQISPSAPRAPRILLIHNENIGAMAPATIARFSDSLPALRYDAYGATETTSPVTLMPPSEHPAV